MEPVTFGMTDAYQPHVKTDERRGGILGRLGMNEKREVTAVLCPECGLVRLYAEDR